MGAYGVDLECEIILRSASEGSIKMLFLCLASGEERTHRIVEFTEGLDAIADIKQHERAVTRLSHMEPNAPDRFIFEEILLDESTLAELRARWPRKVRMRINAKWSYTEMIEWIAKSMQERGGSDVYKTMMHGYGISSHFIHADHRALDLTIDRQSRHEELRSATELAHAARMITDILSQSAMVGKGMLHAIGLQTTPAMDNAIGKVYLVFQSTERFHETFRALISPVGSERPSL